MRQPDVLKRLPEDDEITDAEFEDSELETTGAGAD